MKHQLERVKPEQAGISSAGLGKFLDYIEDMNINLHSFMLLRYGHIAAEGYYKPFHRHLLHPIFSVSKSITSAAVGIAIQEGLFSLQDRVIDFFQDKLAEDVHPYTAMMQVKHLLSMQTVHPGSTDTQGEDWVYSFLNTPPSYPPGTIFAYDTTATHTLCAIIQRTSGQTVLDYLRPRLFDPIGIGQIEWESCPQQINKGGSGIWCTTEDMARFGQLYLQDGIWDGKRILPKGWVERSTSKIVDNSNAKALLDGRQGYGYQFWRCRNDAYCAFGMGGQFIVVVPHKQIVFVTTANTLQNRDEHQLILNGFWEYIYAAAADEPVQDNPLQYRRLLKQIERLQLVLPKSLDRAAPAEETTKRKYILNSNPLGYTSCEITLGPTPELKFCTDQRRVTICSFSFDQPLIGTDPFFGFEAACGASWMDSQTMIVQMQLLNQMQMFLLTCRFEDHFLVIQVKPIGTMKCGHIDCVLIGNTQD
ncbi:serine hydrolase domain-containing protein [Marinicrinis lubricantis]|uniref:Serine hydrolase domain-containing protein n=1 Tax=Marinicrinis lubricantis TaxID=2086470 RepID=A0ABW1IQ38_9BACL